MLTALRQIQYVVLLAGRRLIRRSGRVLFVAVGIGAGAATLATLLVDGTIARDQSLRNAVADVPIDAVNRIPRKAPFKAQTVTEIATELKC